MDSYSRLMCVDDRCLVDRCFLCCSDDGRFTIWLLGKLEFDTPCHLPPDMVGWLPPDVQRDGYLLVAFAGDVCKIALPACFANFVCRLVEATGSTLRCCSLAGHFVEERHSCLGFLGQGLPFAFVPEKKLRDIGLQILSFCWRESLTYSSSTCNTF